MAYTLIWITGQLAVGSAPMSYDDLASIKEQGVGAIVNLCAEFSDLHELEEQAGFEVCYLPVHDECAPDLNSMEQALQWFDEAMYLKKKILVHCRHGMGRTGTFVSAYLLRRGMGLKVAKKTLKGTLANPTNFSQWKLLKKYSRQQGNLLRRKPSITDSATVDLAPFFKEYKNILASIEEKEQQDEGSSFDVTVCCGNYFELKLVEAVFISHSMNRFLSSAARKKAISDALQLRQQAESSEAMDKPQEHNRRQRLWRQEHFSCPLLKEKQCQLFEDRPAFCRQASAVKATQCGELISELSKEVFLTLTNHFPPEEELTFAMHDTVSGKFVQHYFEVMFHSIRS